MNLLIITLLDFLEELVKILNDIVSINSKYFYAYVSYNT